MSKVIKIRGEAMSASLLWSGDGCEIWHGDCLEEGVAEIVLHGRKADLLHVDAPYSGKTHAGHRGGKITADRAAGFGEQTNEGDQNKRAIRRYAAKIASNQKERSDIDYEPWSDAEIERFGGIWMPHVTGWATTITDNVLAPCWAFEFEASDRYVFAPLPWVEVGSRVRMTGDGPSGWTCWAVVARPSCEPWSKWGTLRGAYVFPAENHQNRPDRITGGKSLAGTLAFLGDYSKRGDLVLDPCLGGGTTIIAARMSGRRCIGIEKDPVRAELCARLVSSKREQLSLLQP